MEEPPLGKDVILPLKPDGEVLPLGAPFGVTSTVVTLVPGPLAPLDIV